MTISLYTGCMGAGKSALLIQHYNELYKQGHSICVMTPRGGDVKSRDGGSLSAQRCAIDWINKTDTDYILVDEYQFLPPEVMAALFESPCAVHLYGLLRWSSGAFCNNYLMAVEYASEMLHIAMQCEWQGCVRLAEYNILFTEDGRLDIDSLDPVTGQANKESTPPRKELFKSLCRHCYNRIAGDI